MEPVAEVKAEVSKVVALSWNVFLAWLSDAWHPSHHMAIVGPTGEGKTTFAVPVLKLRKWVMVLDAKGEDATLEQATHKIRFFILAEKRTLVSGASRKLIYSYFSP